jgi:TRAP-type C4-dicarboxylate transport system substrate-binding protein
MNKKKWASLPPDIQKIVQQVSDEWIEKDAANWFNKEKSGRDFGVAKGVKVITFSKEENDKVVKAIEPLFGDYVQSMKKLGLPGEEALKFCQDELKKIQQR